MEKQQVVIIGAGPAGASCAKALHDAGIQALLIEKESLPRHKNCSGVLFGQTQELLPKYFGAMPPEDVYCEPKIIHASQIIEWKHDKGFVQYFWEIPKDGHAFPQTYLNAWRSTFDHWLVKQSGAALRENSVFRGCAADREQVNVDLFLRDPKLLNPGGKGDPNRTIQCDYLVGADGSASAVRRALAPEVWEATPEVSYYQEYCPIVDSGDLRDGCWHVFFEKSVADCSAACTARMLGLCPASEASGAMMCAAAWRPSRVFSGKTSRCSSGLRSAWRGASSRCGRRIQAAAGCCWRAKQVVSDTSTMHLSTLRWIQATAVVRQ